MDPIGALPLQDDIPSIVILKRSDRIQYTFQEVAGSTFAGIGTDFFVVEEASHKAIVFSRLGTNNRFGNGMATAQIVEPSRINPFIVKAATICRLGIK